MPFSTLPHSQITLLTADEMIYARGFGTLSNSPSPRDTAISGVLREERGRPLIYQINRQFSGWILPSTSDSRLRGPLSFSDLGAVLSDVRSTPTNRHR
jgi:hypothetical protein